MFWCSSVFEDVDLTGAGIAILVAMLAVMVLAAVAVNVIPRLAHKWQLAYTTRDLTYGAACLALSYALSWAGVRLPNGGTITIAALVPIFIYCYYFGLRKGMIVTAAYTLLQLLQFPSIVSPWSAFFDYILPYFSLCVVGAFCYKPDKYAAFVKKNKDDETAGARSALKRWAYTVSGHWGIFVGVIIHMLIRYFCQTVSGVMNYDLWYGEGFAFSHKLAFSLSYNAYGLIDSVITLAVLVILLSSRAFNSYMSATFANKKAKSPSDANARLADADTAATEQPGDAGPNATEQPGEAPAGAAECTATSEES